MSTLRLTTISNQSGSSSVPSDTVINGSAKAWVNFNGTGTVAIRASFNVSSITDNGLGDYTVNFTSALSDTNYCYIGIGRRNSATQRPVGISQANTATYDSSTSSFRFLTWVEAAAALEDPLTFNVSVFR